MSRLTGQPVMVLLSGGRDHLSAVVDDDATVSMTLVLAVPPARPYADERVVVQYTTPTGVHRLKGSMSSDPAKREVLHLARDGAEVIQRREWVRVDAVVPVKLRSGDAVGQSATLNVSAGGMLAKDPLALAVGAELAFELKLSDTDVVPGAGEVMTTRPAGEHMLAGIRFTALANADRERIVRFVTERQRQEMRRRKGL